jgi:hypothetical protein
VAFVRTGVSEERISSIINVESISESVVLRSVLQFIVTAYVVPSTLIILQPDDEGDTFLRKVGS